MKTFCRCAAFALLMLLALAAPARADDYLACNVGGTIRTCPANANLRAGTLPATILGSPLQVEGRGTPGTPTGDVLTVQGDPAGTPVPVSAAALPLPTGAATETSLAKLTQTQGSSTSGQAGPLVQAAVTTSAPTYTNGQTAPLSQTTGGALRVSAVGASAFQLLTGLTSGTTLRSGVGTLRKMCVFIPSSGGTGGFYVYDNTAASGTAIVSLFTTTSTCYDLDVRFGTGLTVQMTTAAATVLVTWDTY